MLVLFDTQKFKHGVQDAATSTSLLQPPVSLSILCRYSDLQIAQLYEVNLFLKEVEKEKQNIIPHRKVFNWHIL